MANGYFVPAGETGDEFRYWIVEFEFAVLLEKQSGDGSELLADRANGVAQIGRRRQPGLELRCPIGIGIKNSAVLHYRDSGTRHTSCLKDLARDRVDLPVKHRISSGLCAQ